MINLYINLSWLGVCLSVCLFVSNNRKNGWTDRAKIFCRTSRDPREGLRMIEFSKICLHQNSIFENFTNPRNFFFLPTYTKRTCSLQWKWKMGAKRPNSLVIVKSKKVLITRIIRISEGLIVHDHIQINLNI